MGTYSNGWGHLIVTVAVIVMCTLLLILKAVDPSQVTGLLGTVVAFWFLSGSSKFTPTDSTGAK